MIISTVLYIHLQKGPIIRYHDIIFEVGGFFKRVEIHFVLKKINQERY